MAGQNLIVNFNDQNSTTPPAPAGEQIPPAANPPTAPPAAVITPIIGEVVRVEGERVIFVEAQGGKERSFRLAPNDGTPAERLLPKPPTMTRSWL